jgi:stress-induced morphogen
VLKVLLHNGFEKRPYSPSQAKISEALETENVVVVDASGDGRHVSIDVVSKVFEGKSSVKRQQLVYKAIWLELQDVVHAVDAMTTKTPEEAGLA